MSRTAFNTRHTNPDRSAWKRVSTHARLHSTGDVPKADGPWLIKVARHMGAVSPVAMATAARRVWP